MKATGSVEIDRPIDEVFLKRARAQALRRYSYSVAEFPSQVEYDYKCHFA